MQNRVCILTEHPIETGFDMQLILEKCARAGIAGDRVQMATISNYAMMAGDASVIVPMGKAALQYVTGRESIDKWHLSPLDTLPNFVCRKAVPTFDPNRMKKEWHLGLYIEMALKRANKYATDNLPWKRKESKYLLDPSHDYAIAVLENLSDKDWLSIDIETGRNQINTFGVAWSDEDAIAIKLLPDSIPPAAFHKLWSLVAKLCQSDQRKVMQNGIYERMYLSRYGILVNNFAHDTMCAMKFLWPELEKGLDNVGRIYTMEPYWKDDGRVSSEEGKQKDWGDIRDWPRHLDYNCKDTSNTRIAMGGQRRDLEQRGLLELHDRYLRQLYDCTYEMCATGLPLNETKQKNLISEYEAKSASLVAQLSREINPRSSKAKMQLLKDKGYTIPIKRSTKKESVDELSLKKLRLKYPEDNDLKLLIATSKIEKALSSYLRVRTLPDKRIRFQMDAHGTETGRMSCGLDAWGNGFNAQTMTDYVKQMIEWPETDDRVFVEIDLRQAESRFVAYDAAESTLLQMLERDDDIHSHVAAEVFACSVADVLTDSKRTDIPKNQTKRQLGKKSGHGANYSMGVATFIDSCLKEMDLVLTKQMASNTLEAYHKLFPGIRKWHARIRDTVYRERKLTNPIGRVRYFYGRMDDNTYREAYAYRPQSTVPDIANHLMLHLKARRTEGAFDFALHLQGHDSVLLSCKRETVPYICNFALDTKLWHPTIILTAGQLVIPTESAFGKNLGNLAKYKT